MFEAFLANNPYYHKPASVSKKGKRNKPPLAVGGRNMLLTTTLATIYYSGSNKQKNKLAKSNASSSSSPCGSSAEDKVNSIIGIGDKLGAALNNSMLKGALMTMDHKDKNAKKGRKHGGL
ncbi:hypothetical protein RIF29_09342 [Crotalaria pallida]|uniref:Uncharacterized protein n=1 Tax=Crotalaria pallida TaxID=3830 RepID=A0AAN9FUT2_CROPI